VSDGELPPPVVLIPEDQGSVGGGILLLLLLHLFQIPMFVVGGIFWIGLSQLAYVIPFAVRARKRGQELTVKGLWIGAGITFLLNALCFGALIVALSKTSFH